LWHNRAWRRIVLLLLALWSFDRLVTMVTEAQWMASLGMATVWKTRVATQLMLAALALLVTLGCGALFIRPLARVPRPTNNVVSAYQALSERMFSTHRLLLRASWLVLGALALQQAVRLASGWQDWMLFAHGQRWSSDAPFSGHDLGFYVFRLNWWHRVLNVAWTSATALLLLVALLTVTRCILLIVARELYGAPRWMRALRPVLVTAALWFAVRAAGYYLEPFDEPTNVSSLGHGTQASLLLVERSTSRLGLAACVLMSALCLLPALVAGIEFSSRTPLPVVISRLNLMKWRTLRWIAAVVFCALFIPALAMRLAQAGLGMLQPSSAATEERPKSTARSSEFEHAMRAAWNLDAVQMHSVTVGQNSQAARYDSTSGRATSTLPFTFEIPLWDEIRLSSAARTLAVASTAPLPAQRPVSAQRPDAVQIDRYVQDGKQVLVGAAGHEPARHVVLLSASRVGHDRSPVTIALPEANAAQQGRRMRSANPVEQAAISGSKANTGVMQSWWQRCLWAWRLRDVSLLHTDSGSATRLENRDDNFRYPRSMMQCAQQVVPFLVPDGEPYPLVTEAGVVWMLDLLSATQRFPLVPSTQRVGALRGYNAARDSVKMTMDAQTGHVAFYASAEGEKDPLLQPWRRGFPSLIKPWRDMPAALREHRRYPRGLFEVQRAVLQSTAAAATTADSGAAVYSLWPHGARSVQENSRFVLQGTLWHRAAKNAAESNEVAVLVADCDGAEYGRLHAFRFQHRHQGDASTQAGVRTLATSETSGSSIGTGSGREAVHRVLVPVGLTWSLPAAQESSIATAQRLLQVEARYAPEAGVARLNRVLVSDALDAAQPSAVGADLEQAWRRFRGEDAPGQPRTVSDLARQALIIHEMVQRAASSGDWAGFDVQRKKLRAILLELQAASEQQKAQSPSARSPSAQSPSAR
jgi:uncharacterized membrane protein (UPF0182 family)